MVTLWTYLNFCLIHWTVSGQDPCASWGQILIDAYSSLIQPRRSRLSWLYDFSGKSRIQDSKRYEDRSLVSLILLRRKTSRSQKYHGSAYDPTCVEAWDWRWLQYGSQLKLWLDRYTANERIRERERLKEYRDKRSVIHCLRELNSQCITSEWTKFWKRWEASCWNPNVKRLQWKVSIWSHLVATP